MNKRDRLRFDMFVRVGQFLKDNTTDFPANSLVATQSAVLNSVINNIQALTGEQNAGRSSARFQYNSKATARENLREMLSDISETARSMIYQLPGIDLKFRMPRGDNDAELLARARAFLTDATPLKNDFIAYEIDADFLTDLQALIADFEQRQSATGTSTGAHVEATADIGEEARKGMIAVRTMDGAIKNKYRRDLGKLTAWKSASHIERLPKLSAPVSTNPPNG